MLLEMFVTTENISIMNEATMNLCVRADDLNIWWTVPNVWVVLCNNWLTINVI